MVASEAQVDVFLLYNEREQEPDSIVQALRERGLSVYFFRTDFPFGGEIATGEATRLEAARTVVVLLGEHGWGPTQREIAHRSQSLQKPIIPVLIGQPPEVAFEEVGGMFQRNRWVDLRAPTPDGHDQLARAVREMLETTRQTSSERDGPRFDEIIKLLTDGSEADRFALLQRVKRYGFADISGLAARLRTSIEKDFSPASESQFATAIRDPKRLASTRAWMLSVLIWLEPQSRPSTDLILRHINIEIEPDRLVRFWTLAGIIQTKLAYLARAISMARGDPAIEVSSLAAIASDPNDETTLQTFRSALESERFETAWYVLRILRIYPLPVLAGNVVAQLERSAEGKFLTYDALFALASPEMAREASPLILSQLGLRRFVRIIVNQSRGSAPISIIAFARVLSVFDKQQVRALLQEAAADPEDRQVVLDILTYIDETIAAEPEGEPLLPGHASDKIDVSQDDIGIGRDALTLASVMLARDVSPPLAIGLFGEWGSGKSFYIKSIEKNVDTIKNSGRSQFCSEVVQIHFNAWHYVDTSLWASLVAHMLDHLSAHLAPEKTPVEQRATLVRDLASAKAEIELAKSEQQLATTQLKETTKDLQAKMIEREQSEIKLRDLRAADLLSLLASNEDLDKTLRTALANVGAPAALESISELNKVVEESYSTAGRGMALLGSLFKGPNVWIGLGGLVFFFIAAPLIGLCLETAWNAHAAEISELFAKASAVAGSITLILRQALHKAKSSLDALSEAKRKVDEQLATRRLTPSQTEIQLQEKVTAARANEKAAVERVAAATARAQDLEARVATLADSQSLGYFIAERSRSEDYRRHLGLISMIRKDFDGLVRRVRQEQSKAKGIDRIVLYIDDVDRCPPDMVVDILQAVHLLLAYELFVVVVSVDPRWLLRSLETRMAQLRSEGTAVIEGMGATPQDYLEKIFQIPFSVRPMGQHGFARLMRRLLLPPQEQPTRAPPRAEPDGNRETSEMSAADLSDKQTPSSEGAAIATQPAESVTDPHFTTSASTEIDALASVLVISRAEADFSQKLYMFLPTPRSAKRFTNIYRLLKASLARGDQPSFEGTETIPGDFQLPMLLLALLVGHSKLAADLFPLFLARAREGQDWWEAGWADKSGEPGRLHEELSEIVNSVYFPRSPDLVITWVPQVARYSFNTAKIFLEER